LVGVSRHIKEYGKHLLVLFFFTINISSISGKAPAFGVRFGVMVVCKENELYVGDRSKLLKLDTNSGNILWTTELLEQDTGSFFSSKPKKGEVSIEVLF